VKKILVAILAIFYLSTSTGATIHFHYCSDKLVSWDFGQAKKGKHGKCGENKTGNCQKHGCCNDEYKTIKNGDQKITEPTYNLILFSHFVLVPKIELPAPSISSITKSNPFLVTQSRSTVPINILDCVFLI